MLPSKKKLVLWSGYGLTSSLQVLSVILMARLAGREVVGQYAAITAFALIVVRLADLGLPSSIIYFIRADSRHVNSVAYCVFMHLLAATPLLFFVAYGLRFVPFAEGGLDEVVASSLGPLAILMLAQLSSGLFSNIFIATERYAAYSLLQAFPTALLCTAVYAVHLASQELSIRNLLPITAVTAIVPSLVSALYVLATFCRLSSMESSITTKELYFFGSKTVPGVLAKVVGARLDRIVLSALLPADSLGLYTVGQTMKNALLVPFQAYIIGLPNALFDESKAGRDSYYYMVRSAKWWSASMLIIAILAAIIAPYFVPRLFGPAFAGSINTMRILAVGAVFETFYNHLLQYFLVKRRPELVSVIFILGLCISTSFLIAGATALGLLGAALAVAATSLCLSAASALAVIWIRKQHA